MINKGNGKIGDKRIRGKKREVNYQRLLSKNSDSQKKNRKRSPSINGDLTSYRNLFT